MTAEIEIFIEKVFFVLREFFQSTVSYSLLGTTTDKYPTPRGWSGNSNTQKGSWTHTSSLCWRHLWCSSWGFWALGEEKEGSYRRESGNDSNCLERKIPSPENNYVFKCNHQTTCGNQNKVSPAAPFPDSIPHHPWLPSPFSSNHFFQHNGTAHDWAGEKPILQPTAWCELWVWSPEARKPWIRAPRSPSWLAQG